MHSASELLVGYLDYSAIYKSRREILEPRQHPEGGINAAGCTITRKMLSRITPQDWTHDPYIVCVLLSCGQLQERQERLLHSSQVTDYHVCLSSDTSLSVWVAN
jgi:hypothetical protein